MSEFAVSVLVKKRAELAGEIQAAEVRLRELRANLAHVDVTIRLFDPGHPIAQIAPKKPQPERPVLFERGELGRTILDILRTATEPMTVAQIAGEVMVRLGMAEDRGAREFLESRVDRGIRRQQEQELVEKVVYGPRAVAWRLSPPNAVAHSAVCIDAGQTAVTLCSSQREESNRGKNKPIAKRCNRTTPI